MGRVFRFALAALAMLSVTAPESTARAQAAGAVKVLHGPKTIMPGLDNGQTGYWVSWTDYTYGPAVVVMGDAVS
ncbi:MAG: hypothetical protein KGR26_14360, partial [Cyanobacteria bacterium REEB65]|nr:hypothetical protein [Cyanobacteria bacterium REEB65]